MQKILTHVCSARASLKCGNASLLGFTLVITGMLAGVIPIYEHEPNLIAETILWVVALIALFGLLIGITALLRSMRIENQQTERRRAIGGISVSLLVSIPLLFGLITEYRQRPSRGRLGRDTAALNVLRSVHKGQADFIQLKGRFGTLKELADSGLIEKEYALGKPISGYIYSDTDISSDTYCVHADRESGNSGYGDYNIMESGEIRYIRSETNGTVPRDGGTKMNGSSE